jgi:hypothetical protein
MKCNLKAGFHELVLELAPGRHEYQLVVNGDLAPDQYARESKAILGLPSRSIVVVTPAGATSVSE